MILEELFIRDNTLLARGQRTIDAGNLLVELMTR